MLRKRGWTRPGVRFSVGYLDSDWIPQLEMFGKVAVILTYFSSFVSSFIRHQTMQNEAGQNVDLYVPRKCSWTNQLIRAKDHASVQINVANVDPVTGVATGDSTPYCLGGYIRFKSEGDMALTDLVQKKDTAMLAGSNE